MKALALIAAIHAALRFGGLWMPALVPLSMMVIWPMPWVGGYFRSRRAAAGFRRCQSTWLVAGIGYGAAAAAACAAVAWTVHGVTDLNWFHRHALALGEAAAGMPPGLSVMATFWFVTIPAMIFSPTAEEVLFRGYLQLDVTERHGVSRAIVVQAAAFAVIHLAHYGLRPWQPGLIPVWLLSMFCVGWLLGWIRHRSDSLWPAMAAHAAFNLVMNAVAMWMFGVGP